DAIMTRVYTIDLASFTANDDPAVVQGGASGHVVVNSDGSRAVQVTTVNRSTHVAVIDTSTGAILDDSIYVTGNPYGNAQFSEDETRIVLSTMTGDGLGSAPTSRIAIIDAESGHQIGDTIMTNGYLTQAVQFDPVGTWAVAVVYNSGLGGGPGG